MSEDSVTSQLTTQKNERVKQYIEFDPQGRSWKVYTAQVNAQDNQECEVTEYVYKDISSTEMKARKEGVGTWDSTWDSLFTI